LAPFRLIPQAANILLHKRFLLIGASTSSTFFICSVIFNRLEGYRNSSEELQSVISSLHISYLFPFLLPARIGTAADCCKGISNSLCMAGLSTTTGGGSFFFSPLSDNLIASMIWVIDLSGFSHQSADQTL